MRTNIYSGKCQTCGTHVAARCGTLTRNKDGSRSVYCRKCMSHNTIIPLAGGWKEHTLYLAEVSYNSQNPLHIALVYIGFLQDGKPSTYSGVMRMMPSCHDCELDKHIEEMYYVRIIRELVSCPQTAGCGKLPPRPTSHIEEELLRTIAEITKLSEKVDKLQEELNHDRR